MCICANSLNCVFLTLWTIACQDPLSTEFPSKNTRVGCHVLLQGNLPNPGVELTSPMSPASPLLLVPPRKSLEEEAAAAAAKSLQSCPALCDPIDGSPRGSSIPGILQARTLEWVAISFSNAWKWKVKVKLLSHVRLLAIPWTAAYQAPLPMGFSRQPRSGLPLPSPLEDSPSYFRGPYKRMDSSDRSTIHSFIHSIINK